MTNIASILKSEIVRLARKEVRSELESLKKASAHYRSEIAELKRRLASLEKAGARKARTSEPALTDGEPAKLRFSAKRLAAQRKKQKLSAAEMGALVGVSAQTIYNWEAGKARPRQSQLPAIAATRKLGVRGAKAQLEAMAAKPQP